MLVHIRRLLLVSGTLSAALACDAEERPVSPAVSEAAAGASAALESAKKAAAEKVSRKVVRRAKNEADLVVTPERRAKLEAAVPEAKGFLDQRELEPLLFKRELKRGATDDGLEAFDKLAKGRFVLFSGNIIDPKAERFDLAVRYTPRDPADPVGLTATWFPVHFERVAGYDPNVYHAGDPIAVLAFYEGQQTTQKARDVILLEQWF
jgi:hypothetical protein